MKIERERYMVGHVSIGRRIDNRDNEEWSTGSVFTPFGIVAFNMRKGNDPFTIFFFIRDGKEYTHWDRVTYSEDGLNMRGNRFAEQLTAGIYE